MLDGQPLEFKKPEKTDTTQPEMVAECSEHSSETSEEAIDRANSLADLESPTEYENLQDFENNNNYLNNSGGDMIEDN